MAVFAADTFSGLTSGTSISGRTTSDGSSVWTLHGSDFKGNGAGGVWPVAGNFIGELVSIDNNVASQSNQDITWEWVPQADPKLTGGNGWSHAVWAKIRNTTFSQGVFACFDTASGSGGEVYLVENDAYGSFRRVSTSSSYITTLVSTISCTMSIRAGVVTLTGTGGASFSVSLTLSITAGGFGAIGLSAYSPAGGTDATNGVHIHNISASNYTSAATGYSLIPPKDISTGGSAVIGSSKYPNSFNIANTNVGRADAGFAGNRLWTLALNGVAPVGGFVFTPTAGTMYDTSDVLQSTLTIASGADSYEFAYAPAAGTIADVNVGGTNNSGYSNNTVAYTVRPRTCYIDGDSISDTGFGALWPAAVQTAIGTGWLIRTSAAAYSAMNSGAIALNIRLRMATTVVPFHDANRTREAVIIWGGTNNIYSGDSGATTFTALEVAVNALKANNWRNIAIITMLPRDGSAASGGQSAMNTRKNDYNTLIKANYGSTGTDTSVTVLDIGGDGTMGGDTAWSNATYYPDGTHPQSSASSTIINSYVQPWLEGVPASPSEGTTAVVIYSSELRKVLISASSSGDNTLVAAVTGYKIRVHSYKLVAAGAVTTRFESAAGGTALTSVMSQIAGVPNDVEFQREGCIPDTVVSELLNLELGGAVQVSGHLVYSLIAA